MLKSRKIPKEVINYDMCEKCGGRCCKSNPCQYLPSDFEEPIIDSIENEILNNRAIIDIGKIPDCSEDFFYLRARRMKEDLNNPKVTFDKKHIYLADKNIQGFNTCLFYKYQIDWYHAIKIKNYDEQLLRAMSEKELYELFKYKIKFDTENKKFKSMEQNIQEFLDYKKEFGWGGCLLQEHERPGGALYVVPNYVDGIPHCKSPEEFYNDDWDQPEHQEKLRLILKNKNII